MMYLFVLVIVFVIVFVLINYTPSRLLSLL